MPNPSRNGKNNSCIRVRAMRDADAPAVATIWREGLAQTAEAAPWWFRLVLAAFMERYGSKALQPDGDVGPKGQNLMQQWNRPGQEHRRRMFVACLVRSNRPEEQELDQDPKDSTDRQDETWTVVGVVGVTKGFSSEMHDDENDTDDDSDIASIWRMSVDASVRRQGVGLALMEHAEDWARQQGCTRMRLITANAIAAQFYTQKAGYVVEELNKSDSNDPSSLSWWLDHLRQPWRAMSLVHFYVKKL